MARIETGGREDFEMRDGFPVGGGEGFRYVLFGRDHGEDFRAVFLGCLRERGGLRGGKTNRRETFGENGLTAERERKADGGFGGEGGDCGEEECGDSHSESEWARISMMDLRYACTARSRSVTM